MKEEELRRAMGEGGMFATEDQYRVVPGNGHEIIDRIRYRSSLSHSLNVRRPFIRS